MKEASNLKEIFPVLTPENKHSLLQKIAKGLSILKITSNQMIGHQNAHQNEIDPVVSARNFRFIGRQADLLRLYPQSEKYYRQGLTFFEALERIDQRYQSLELNGFLSYSFTLLNSKNLSHQYRTKVNSWLGQELVNVVKKSNK